MTAATMRRGPTILPEGAQDAIWRAWRGVLGAAVMFAGLALGLALLTYAPGDPSFNNASAAATANWMGRPGAHIADLLLQTIGAASGALALALVVWGGRIAKGTATRWFWLRAAALPVAALALSLFAAALARPPGWPIRPGFGGVIGDMGFGRLAEWAAREQIANAGLWFGLALGVLGALLFAIALGASLSGARRALRRLVVMNAAALRASGAFLLGLPATLSGLFARRDAEARAEPVFRINETGLAHEPGLPEEPPLGDRPPILDERPGLVARTPKKPARGKRELREAQGALDLEPRHDEYELPALSLLAEPKPLRAGARVSDEALQQNARLLESVLEDFGVKGEIIQVRPGPVVTLYELEPAPGVKSARVIGLADDIARSMSALSARVAVVPGRNAIGVELPNARRDMVLLRELVSSADYEKTTAKLTLALGKTIGGEPVIADLARMPHLLIAGTTGSGKSVAINTMILSLLYRLPPAECKMIMIDPKMLELSVYEGIPHLLTPVVTDPKKAVVALKWVVREMEDRYRRMSKLGVRNIAGYNARAAEAIAKGEVLRRVVQTGFDKETGEPIHEEETLEIERLPMIVVVVDEMADLMLVAGKDVEASIQRLAQMARAAGIHLIMATQRPSVDVITGTIKANFPTRISFQVTSKIDSRTILGEMGAEQLLGQGDMLYMEGGGRIRRVHGPFVSDAEVEKIVAYLKTQGEPDYVDSVTEESDEDAPTFLDMVAAATGQGAGEAADDDTLYDHAVAIVANDRKCSTSYIQRKLQIGYNRAARLVERMEQEGVVSRANHVGKREILLPDHGGEG